MEAFKLGSEEADLLSGVAGFPLLAIQVLF